MTIDPTVQLAIVTGFFSLITWYLNNKLVKKVDANTILTTAAADEAKSTAKEAKKFAEVTAKAVDGQMSEFKAKLEETVDLKVTVATLQATAAGKEEGAAKEKLANFQAGAIAAARSLAPTDEKIVNGGKEQPAQADRIEAMGDDSNLRVRKVETMLGDRVEKVEEKLDEKRDK